jgi:hypothetical protein
MSFLKQACAAALLLAGCGGGGGGDDSSSMGFPLVSIEGITYTTNITIGGSQKFDVVLDTGSTTLAVAGSSCTNCGVTPSYSPGSTGSDQHSTSTAEYGDQSMWQAENFSDTVAVTGDSSLTMRFASITSQTGFFRQGVPSEGILGMGGEAIASPGTDAYIAERTKSSLGDNFAVQLCVDDGTLWFGAPDKSSEASAEAYTPLVQITSEPSYYAVNVASAGIGSASIGISGEAVVDTGTSIMVLSSAAVNSLISAVTSSPSYSAAFGSQTLSGDASRRSRSRCPIPAPARSRCRCRRRSRTSSRSRVSSASASRPSTACRRSWAMRSYTASWRSSTSTSRRSASRHRPAARRRARRGRPIIPAATCPG